MGRVKKPHFFFKIAAKSGVGEKLKAFMAKCAQVDEQARKWVEKQGASSYYESPDGMAGGVVMVQFDANVLSKEGWQKVQVPGKEGMEYLKDNDGRCFWIPTEGSDIEKEMQALPLVSEAELIGILQFKPKEVKKDMPVPFTFGNETPMVFLHHDFWYVDIPYDSLAGDCQAITEKEFCRRRMAALNEQK